MPHSVIESAVSASMSGCGNGGVVVWEIDPIARSCWCGYCYTGIRSGVRSLLRDLFNDKSGQLGGVRHISGSLPEIVRVSPDLPRSWIA